MYARFDQKVTRIKKNIFHFDIVKSQRFACDRTPSNARSAICVGIDREIDQRKQF